MKRSGSCLANSGGGASAQCTSIASLELLPGGSDLPSFQSNKLVECKTMIEGACHCGALSWRFEGPPGGATACNCTICRRHGALWIYGHEGEEISVSGEARAY